MIILIKYEVPSKIEQGRGKMKKIISNLSVVIFVIGCVIMEITTWFIDSYVMFYNRNNYCYSGNYWNDYSRKV